MQRLRATFSVYICGQVSEKHKCQQDMAEEVPYG